MESTFSSGSSPVQRSEAPIAHRPTRVRKRFSSEVGAVLGLLLGFAAVSAWGDPPETGPDAWTEGHIDLRVSEVDDPEFPLEIRWVDEDRGLTLAPTNVVLVVDDAARIALPVDFLPVGSAGEAVWILPQSQNPAVPFLGLSAEGMDPGRFEGALDLRLLEVNGPGEFFLWQAEVGGVQFFFNSRDGFGDDDGFPLFAGGHSHANWGFTTNGAYHLMVQARGRRVGEVEPILSPPARLTFHVGVVPIPATPFAEWQREFWPMETSPAMVAAEGDPDGDHRANLVEYVEGTDPRAADAAGFSALSVAMDPSASPRVAILQARAISSRTDLRVTLESADSPSGPWTVADFAGPAVSIESDPSGERRVWTWRDSTAGQGAGPGRRFYRLAYRLDSDG